MRSKKIRIVITGSFLTALTVVLALRKEAAAPPRPLELETKQASTVIAPESAALPAVAEPVMAAPAALQSALWKYTNKPASAARVESLMATPSHEVHYAQIDHSLLSSDQSPLKHPGAQMDVTLPNGTVLPVLITATENLGEDRYVSEGTINGGDNGRAVFAYSNGEMSAVIDEGEAGSWQMRSVGSSTSQVFKVDATMVPPCNASLRDTVAAKLSINSATRTTPSAASDGPAVSGDVQGGSSVQVNAPQLAATTTAGKTEVRILMPYSRVIETVMSKASIQSAIDLAIGQLNNDLARSAIPVTVKLAGAPSLQYNQEWDSSTRPTLTALTRINSSTDGIMDEVHVLRVDAKADLVCFAMCRNDPANTGVGYILNVPGDVFNPLWGFSVVNFWSMSSNSTFSHEIGHNLGCNHDREHGSALDGTSVGNVYHYSYGYRFYGKDAQQYRTIMAYPPGNVLPYFSNPNLTAWSPISVRVGVPLGQANEAYNALTITQNAAEVASYRNSGLIARMARRIRGY